MSREKSQFSARFTQARLALGFATDRAFADHTGIPRATVGAYTASSEEPITINTGLLSEISDRGISLEWLVTGDGEMLRRADPEQESWESIRIKLEKCEAKCAALEKRMEEFERTAAATDIALKRLHAAI